MTKRGREGLGRRIHIERLADDAMNRAMDARAAKIPAAVTDTYNRLSAEHVEARDALLKADGVVYRCHGSGYHWRFMRRVGRKWVELDPDREAADISRRVATHRFRSEGVGRGE